MNTVDRPFTLEEFYRRIDEMPMSARDRAHAKANLRTAEAVAETLSRVLIAVRSLAAWTGLSPTRRSMLRNLPAPR